MEIGYVILKLPEGQTACVRYGGTKLLSYTYAAWGNCTVTGSTTTGAQYNPFRYRGYYYDSELGLYYLNSRYYDANIGRFINADIHINANGDLIGFNLFAYCGNNPIKYVDHTGELIEIPAIVAVSAVALAALTIATVTIVCINTDRAAKKIREHAQTANIPFESTYSHSVYVLKDGDQIVRYVGRTKQHPEDRLAQHQQDPLHKERENYKMSVIATGLTYEQAKTLEQLLISAFTVQYLDNIRREIAVKNTESYNKYLRALMDIYITVFPKTNWQI